MVLARSAAMLAGRESIVGVQKERVWLLFGLVQVPIRMLRAVLVQTMLRGTETMLNSSHLTWDFSKRRNASLATLQS